MENSFRYPGIQPFNSSEGNQFFGRDHDIESLYKLISLENLVILFGKSGNGKSSLLNAGVLPKLEEQNLVIPIRFNACIPGKESTTPLESAKEKLLKFAEPDNFIYNKLIPFVDIHENLLWFFCKNIQLQNEKVNSIILVFDQFEELFSYPEDQVNSFKQEIADLIYLKIPQELRNKVRECLEKDRNYLSKEENQYLNNALNIKILISIRQDKISGLNQMTDVIPTILNKCFELKPLTEEQAKEAIIRPSRINDMLFISEPFEFSYSAVEKIITELSNKRKQPIETFQLQIVCKFSENIIINNEGKNNITANDLGDIKDIHKRFYDNLIIELDISDSQRKMLRKLLEEQFIYEQDKRRLQVFRGKVLSEISEDTLIKVEKTHLIRSEPYQDSFTYELSHDTLVEPILESCRFRREKEIREQEEMQREQEIKAINEKSRKQRKLIASISIAAIFALALAAFGIFNWIESNKAKKTAEKFLRAFYNTQYSKACTEIENLSENNRFDDAIKLIDTCYKYALGEEQNSKIIENKYNELIRQKKVFEELQGSFIEIDSLTKNKNYAAAIKLCNKGLMKSKENKTLLIKKQQILAEIKLQINNKKRTAELAKGANQVKDSEKLIREIELLKRLLE